MTAANYTMMGSVAALIAQTLRSYDCDPEPLFDRAGLDMALLIYFIDDLPKAQSGISVVQLSPRPLSGKRAS